MVAQGLPRFGEHHRLVIAAFVVLLAVIAAESFFLNQQRTLNKTTRAQSDQLLTAFLRGDTALSATGSSVLIQLQNVRFKWSDKVYIDAGSLAVRAVPVQGRIVDFDALESFHLLMQRSVVRIRPDVLAGMFNESVFNYPGSRVRELRVSISMQDKSQRMVVLDGRLSLGAWVPFTMYTRLSVDTLTNTLDMEVDHLKVFGIIPATKLIRWTPLHLDRLIALPPNQSLWVDGNHIRIKPFGLFPPPRINGRLKRVVVDDGAISIVFAGAAIPGPKAKARNYVYLRGGESEFGHFHMVDTDILILDKNQANPFVFSLLRYAEQIPRSTVEIPDMHSARITMPDL